MTILAVILFALWFGGLAYVWWAGIHAPIDPWDEQVRRTSPGELFDDGEWKWPNRG